MKAVKEEDNVGVCSLGGTSSIFYIEMHSAPDFLEFWSSSIHLHTSNVSAAPPKKTFCQCHCTGIKLELQSHDKVHVAAAPSILIGSFKRAGCSH